MHHKCIICQGHEMWNFCVTVCESVESAIYYIILNCIINGSREVIVVICEKW